MTGVQTCALPISCRRRSLLAGVEARAQTHRPSHRQETHGLEERWLGARGVGEGAGRTGSLGITEAHSGTWSGGAIRSCSRAQGALYLAMWLGTRGRRTGAKGSGTRLGGWISWLEQRQGQGRYTSGLVGTKSSNPSRKSSPDSSREDLWVQSPAARESQPAIGPRGTGQGGMAA